MASLPVNLVSTLAMGFVLLVIAVGIARGRTWRRAPTGESNAVLITDASKHPVTWVVGFVALAVVTVLVSIGFVGGGVPGLDKGTAGIALVTILLVLFAALLGGGVYTSAKNRGLGNAMAAGIGSIVLGGVLLVAIALKLVTA